ncbi:MAG TPA: hypothetical protein PK771_16020 [Spirochaetota bacterium]|nr:hypothetical protein [Spirochaetota bacterium]
MINDLIIESGTQPIVDLNINKSIFINSHITIYQNETAIWNGYFSDSIEKIHIAEPINDLTKYQIEISKNEKKKFIHFTVLKLKRDEPYIICDIDFTLSATNAFLYLTENLLKIKKIYHSREVLQDLSQNIKIIYLTGRIIKYANLTKKWLALNGYPDGPLISRNYGIPYNLENFKKYCIEDIIKISPNGIGIGDLKSDILAYQFNKIVPIRIIHPFFSYSKKDNYLYKNDHYIVNSWKGIEKLFREKVLF